MFVYLSPAPSRFPLRTVRHNSMKLSNCQGTTDSRNNLKVKSGPSTALGLNDMCGLKIGKPRQGVKATALRICEIWNGTRRRATSKSFRPAREIRRLFWREKRRVLHGPVTDLATAPGKNVAGLRGNHAEKRKKNFFPKKIARKIFQKNFFSF